MLELCARREKQTCEKGRNPKQEVNRCQAPTCTLNLRVLCPNHFTGKEKPLSGLESSSRVRIFISRATPPTLTLWDEHTSIAQCSTKCCVKPLARARIKHIFPPFFFSFFWGAACSLGDATRSLFSLSLRVEGKMALNATTSLQNKLVFRYLLISLHL